MWDGASFLLLASGLEGHLSPSQVPLLYLFIEPKLLFPAKASFWPQKPKPLFKGLSPMTWDQVDLPSDRLIWTFHRIHRIFSLLPKKGTKWRANTVDGGLRVLQKLCLWQICTDSRTGRTENSGKFKASRNCQMFAFSSYRIYILWSKMLLFCLLWPRTE